MAKEKSFEHAVKTVLTKEKKVILRNKFLRFADFTLNMDAEPLLELYWVFNVYLATVLFATNLLCNKRTFQNVKPAP